MFRLQKIGNGFNVPVQEYYVESKEDLDKLKNVPEGSVATMLTKSGLKVYMRHSDGTWVEI